MRKWLTALTAMILCLQLPCTALAASNACIPCTGDAFPMYTWIAVMVLTLIALIVAVIYFWKSLK